MLYAETAEPAELTVLDNTVFVKTDAYEVQFENGVITQLHNKLTGETYTLPLSVDGVPIGISGRSGLLRRSSGHVWMDQTTARKVAPLKAELVFHQGQNEVRLFIAIDINTGDLLIEQEGTSDTADVSGIQWGCGNLDVRNLDLILPAEGGQIIDTISPTTSRSFDYPEDWEAQLAIIQAEQGGFYVRGADETFGFFKVLHYEKDIESFALNFETQNQAPFDTLTAAKSITWRLNTYIGDWRVPAQQYRDWMDQTFNPRKLTEMPAWVSEIGLVVIYHGQEIALLKPLAAQIDPTRTLLYLTQWRKDGYDTNYPDYTASENFGAFLDAARQHGFRVMLHTNFLGVAPYHPLYDTLQKYQLRDRWSGTPKGWFWDRPEAPKRHAFINPASSEFRKIFVQQLTDVSEKYPVDAFHLDVSLIAENDANGLIEGLNSLQGNVLMHKELVEAMPGVVFSGESLHEGTFLRESFAQRWKLPPEWDPTPRGTPHPISAFLFSPYTAPYGYLGLPNPDRGPQLYQEYLEAYENWGVLPTLRLWSMEDLDPERVETQKLLSIARTWQALGFKPNFEKDWEPDTLFQYVAKNGEIATLKVTDNGTIFNLPQDEVGYERVFGVTQLATDRSLLHWHAYNETTILGLHPEKSYLLQLIEIEHRFSISPHPGHPIILRILIQTIFLCTSFPKMCYNINNKSPRYTSKVLHFQIGEIAMPKVTFVLFLCAFLIIPSLSIANVAEDGLVAYWPFDEGNGKKAEDVTGNGHDGEFNGNPKWIDGKFETGLEFDGEEDYVAVADDAALAIEENITIMAWFSPNDVLTRRRLMVKNDSIFVIFDFGNADSIDFLVKPNNTFAESKTTDWKIGEWYHFAGTFDGKTMKVYINGKLEGEADNDVPIAPSNLELWIGGDDFGRPTDFFPGKIDEVRLYKKTLSEADIQKVMETPQDVEARGKLTTTWGKLKAGL